MPSRPCGWKSGKSVNQHYNNCFIGMEKIPILKMGPFLLVTIQVDLYDRLALNLEADLIQMVNKIGAKGVLIDISAVNIVDSFMGRILGNIASMSKILDAHTVVVGMQPAVGIT